MKREDRDVWDDMDDDERLEAYGALIEELDALKKKLERFSRQPAEAAGSEHRWRFSCGRVHEECVGCALRSVEPPECDGHPEGAIACERFKPLRPLAEAVDKGGA